MGRVFAKLLQCDLSVSLTKRSTFTRREADLPFIVSFSPGEEIQGLGGAPLHNVHSQNVLDEVGSEHTVDMETGLQPVCSTFAFSFPYDIKSQGYLMLLEPPF